MKCSQIRHKQKCEKDLNTKVLSLWLLGHLSSLREEVCANLRDGEIHDKLPPPHNLSQDNLWGCK